MDPPLKAWIASKPDVVAIEYHTPFPYPGDPFYLYARPEQDARRAYYGVTGVPRVLMDGPDRPTQTNPAAYEMLYAAHKAVPSLASLATELVYDVQARVGSIEVTVSVPTAPPPGTWRLRAALTQSEIHYEAPNGIDLHHHVFRRFLGGPDGTPVSFTAPFPDAFEVSLPFSVDADWPPEDVEIVVLFQNDDDTRVDQAAVAALSSLLDMDDPIGMPGPDRISFVAPNPFRPATTIGFHLARGGHTEIRVYDAAGALVRQLHDGSLSAGRHRIAWNGRGENDGPLGSGVYWIELRGPSITRSVERAVLLP